MSYCNMEVKTKHVTMRIIFNGCTCRMDAWHLGIFIILEHNIKLGKA